MKSFPLEKKTDFKMAYTRLFLKEAGLEHDKKTAKKYKIKWFYNFGKRGKNGARMKKECILHLKENTEIKLYEIKFSKELVFTAKIIMWLNEYIDCPYYVDEKKIIVTSKKKYIELLLFAGNLEEYSISKTINRQKF